MIILKEKSYKPNSAYPFQEEDQAVKNEIRRLLKYFGIYRQSNPSEIIKYAKDFVNAQTGPLFQAFVAGYVQRKKEELI